MATAPSILDYLNDESKAYFEKVTGYLNAIGIAYTIDPKLVRGLDYYNHTAFEVMSEAEGFGAITTLCGGGRYNGLVKNLGGPESPGIGFAFSIERFIAAMEAEKIECPVENGLTVLSLHSVMRRKIVLSLLYTNSGQQDFQQTATIRIGK